MWKTRKKKAFWRDGADTVGSFVTLSTFSWNIAVPPDGIKFAYEFLRMSASHSVLNKREVSWIPLASYIEDKQNDSLTHVLSLWWSNT